MKKLLIPIIFIGFSFCFISCVTVKVYSQLNPDIHPPVLKHILVVGNFQDIVWQHQFEDQIGDAITNLGSDLPNLFVMKSYKYIFQGYRDRPDEYEDFIKKAGIEAVLVVKIKSYEENSSEFQITPQYQTTKGTFTPNGYGIDYNSMTTTHGGDTIQVNKSKFLARMDLIDVTTKVIIWTSEAYVSTSSVGPFNEDGLSEYAWDSADDLIKTGILGISDQPKKEIKPDHHIPF